ncbi:hypothetical protein ABFU82_25600 [Nocardioides sp. WV_118_6]
MELPENVADLMRADRHPCWLTLLGPHEAATFDDVARVAGLEPLGKRWHEMDRAGAASFLTALLHRSLAYRAELMREKTAAWLTAQFLDAVGSHGSRFAANSADLPGTSPFGWESATEYTMDAGLVAIGAEGAALYWVADED